MINAFLFTKLFAASCQKEFFLMPAWYKYMQLNDKCQVAFRGGTPNPTDFFNSFGLIALAAVDILLRIGGLVAVAFVIYGGIQYISSRGEPDAAAKARGTVLNALLGLAITIIATAFVGFIGNRLGAK